MASVWFLLKFGFGSESEFEFDPTWREMPEVVVGIIKAFMDSEGSMTEDCDFRAYRLQRTDELCSTLKGEDREEFDAWLEECS